MNCVIKGSNVKLLAKTVHFFSKIGSELLVEALPTGLSLKVVNSMGTAYAVANFNMEYFISFNQGANDCFVENNCKVFIKPILKIFKNLHTILICKIWLQIDRMKIIFQFKCKAHVLKTHKISLLEHDHINSLRLPESFANKIVSDHKSLNGILLHFHRSNKEITFDMKTDEIIVTNYMDHPTKDKTTMRSMYSIKSRVFKLYDLESDSKLTFCYKEFKAMTCYAGQNRMLVEMNFNNEGSPILIRMRKDNVLHVTFIMGTMRPRLAESSRKVQRANRKPNLAAPVTERDSQLIELCPTPSYQTSDMRGTNSHLRDDVHSIELASSMIDHLQPYVRNSNCLSTKNNKQSESLFLHGLNIQPQSASTSINKSSQLVNSLERNPPVETRDKPLSFDIVFAGNTDDLNSESLIASHTTPFKKRSFQPQSVNINQPHAKKGCHLEAFNSEPLFSSTLQTDISVEVVVPETVPESPEAIADRKRRDEKMRHIFHKCFEATFDSQQCLGTVYAENSDTEDS
ncbi:cell cycle checkpoint control protein RAD9B isoform X2 [Malaya genurostris]|uniref:cell cycle checkpoint control protein RAD9B isoform X2 n=1 Tax=Malaya genurostris TaxID=325434 RepID=UPI0026F40905|nr:cell cycle checkpoint control protein RAD9B isoform X2 [Malaya genurostris]